MSLAKTSNRNQALIAACLLALPAISTAQQVAINSGYPLAVNSVPTGITAGPDGALWFTEYTAGNIGRITTAGAVTTYPVPTTSSAPSGITVGPDNALWFTEGDPANKIGRITTAGQFTEFPIPTAQSEPTGITLGPDHALWFTETNANQIGRITTTGKITEYPVPTANSGLGGIYQAGGITAGPDGALWFTEYFADKIGRITTAGVIKEYPVPTGPTTGLGPSCIATGPDGALWFTDTGGSANSIGRISAAGVVTNYPLPSADSGPAGITTGPDGALWFADSSGDNIGRITTAGAITQYPLPNPSQFALNQITTGPDGELWFTEAYSTNRIGELFFVTATLTASPSSGIYQSSVTFSGSGFGPNEKVNVYTSGAGSAVLAHGATNSSGSFTAATEVPQAFNGAQLFVGVGQTSGKLGAATFSIVPLLTLTPTSGPAGASVTAEGYGFGSLEHVKIYWPNPNIKLGKQTTNSIGTFSGSGFTFTVPAGSPSGPAKVEATGPLGEKAFAMFTVQ
jgi:virginiamycin B lyase